MFHKALLVPLLLILSAVGVRAQGVRLFTSADGIPSSRFISIHQDAEGYIWMGNDGGLSRMIGSTITSFYEKHGKDKLKSNLINAFITDAKGQLWLGTNAGLQLFHPKTELFEEIPLELETNPSKQNKSTASFIAAMTLLPDNNTLLVCLGQNGYFVLDIRTHKVLQNQTETYRKILNKVVGRQLYCDSKARLWIVTANGLVLMDLKTMSLKPLLFESKTGIYANNLEITSILEDKNSHSLLFGDTKYSVLRYDEQENTIRSFSQKNTPYKNVQCLLQLKNGTILVGCDRNGIGLLHYATQTIGEFTSIDTYYPLAECKIHQMLEDRWGNLYLCLYQKGLLVVPPFQGGFQFKALTNGKVNLNSTAITSINKTSDNKLFVCTDGNGIFRGSDFDKMQRFTLPPSCNGNIYKMVIGKDDKQWIATYGSGLYVSNREEVTSVPNQAGVSNRNVSCLSFDQKQRRLFIGNIGSGLNELNLTTGKMRNLPFCRPWIFSLSLDSQNRLWIGGFDCFVYDLNRSKVHRLTLSTKKDVLCYTFLELNGLHYIGTNNGLYVYNDSTNHIKHVALTNNTGCIITAFAKGRNHQLWMSSNLGLIRFDPKHETFHVFASYEVKKTGDFFVNAVLEQADGTIVFGGDNGVVTFNPKMLEHESQKAESIRLTTLTVDGKEVSFYANAGTSLMDAALGYATRIKLPYTQNSFSIGFSVFNYAVSSKIRFKYRLEGFEDQWNATSTDRPEATYNQVPPGKYKLIIKSFNEEFDLALSEKTIDIYVSAPWYWSWWSKVCYTLVVLGFALALWLMYRTRSRSRKRLRALIGELLSLKQNYQNLIQKDNSSLVSPQNTLDDKLKTKIVRIVSENISNSAFGVEELSRAVAMSRVHLYRRSKELLNCSPNDLIKAERMKQAGLLLVQSKSSITDIAYQVGFSDSSYFSRSFKSYYNLTPKAFVAKYKDQGDEQTLKELFEI